jgi:hypothetical protein
MEINYFEPDSLMPYYQFHTGEDFVKAYLVKGDFGPEVPKDIKDSYKTAEYLMAHSYYHWPMYDEAFWKVLSIYEMAVQFRCKELGIGLKTSKEWRKNLDVLHKELMQALHLDQFKYTFDWVRKLRNDLAHPEIHSFGGGLYKTHIELIVKFINMIFETKEPKHLGKTNN